MKADCVQSLESREEYAGCRFVDSWGFCYAYNSAQKWCATEGVGHPYCHDGGADWGKPPLGDAEGPQTGWTPGTFPYRGSSEDLGSLECMCYKDCSCTSSKCWCADQEQAPVGPVRPQSLPSVHLLCTSTEIICHGICVNVFLTTPFVWQGTWRAPAMTRGSKAGECGCFCNVVGGGGRRRSLLANNMPVLADFVHPVMPTSKRLAFLKSTGMLFCVHVLQKIWR
jgi:hypothetical protein